MLSAKFVGISNTFVSDFDNAMVTWCSKMNNMCVIQRAFQGNEGIIIVTYTNKMPHYSQNMFGQWSNILSHVKLYNPITDTDKTKIVKLMDLVDTVEEDVIEGMEEHEEEESEEEE